MTHQLLLVNSFRLLTLLTMLTEVKCSVDHTFIANAVIIWSPTLKVINQRELHSTGKDIGISDFMGAWCSAQSYGS